MTEKLFAPFEIALQAFHDAGGAHVTAIRIPSAMLDEYLRTLPSGSAGDHYMDTPVLLSRAQGFVSIRGKSITGRDVEIPSPMP